MTDKTFIDLIADKIYEDLRYSAFSHKNINLCAQNVVSEFENQIDKLIRHIEHLNNNMEKIDPLKNYECYNGIIKSLEMLKKMIKN